MDKTLQNYYEAQFEMFASPGWKELIEQAQEIKEAVDKITNAQSVEQFWQRKGEIVQINWLLNWETSCREAFEELQNEEKNA